MSVTAFTLSALVFYLSGILVGVVISKARNKR